MLKLTEEAKELIKWAETADGQESHRVMAVKIKRLAVLLKKLLLHLEKMGELNDR